MQIFWVFIINQEIANRFLVKVRGYTCGAVYGLSWQAVCLEVRFSDCVFI